MTFSSSSSTGPQYCDWQQRRRREHRGDGLAAADDVRQRHVCSGHCGLRVQIGSTPSVFAVVGDAARGAAAPTTGASARSLTWTANGTFLPLTSATAFQTPATGNVASTT